MVLFNATPEPKTWSDAALRGRQYKLHKTQRTSDDELTTTAQFVPGQGRFRIPPRTTAVFVED
jgi:pullulanase